MLGYSFRIFSQPFVNLTSVTRFPFLAQTGFFWSWRPLWVALGPSCGLLARLVAFGGALGPSWRALGCFWAALGLSWAALEAVLRGLGGSWGVFGDFRQ